jgi:hypothetical protein
MSPCEHCGEPGGERGRGRRPLLEGPLAVFGLGVAVMVIVGLAAYLIGSLLAWLVSG